MKKFLLTFLFTILFCGTCFISTAAAQSSDLKYYKVLSASQRESICSNLRSAQSSTSGSDTSLGSDVIPDVVLTSIYNTTRNISGSVSLISVLGDALMCHSIHAARNTAKIPGFGIELFDYPKFSIWIPGFLIYIVAFFLVLSITFYVVDIAFKLGFAVLMLPIAIALWPFPPTKSKLNTIISIILNNAAIFIFLAVAVSFTLNMIMVAVGDLSFVFEAIDTNNTDAVAETFTLTSTDFLVIFAALVYGMKLISNTAKDFTNKFFPDQVFKGKSPIHGSMTQGLDFINKKVVQPAFTLGRDIARTQTGKLVEKGGAFLAGDYHQQVVSFIHNPKASFKKAGYKVASKLETAAGGVTKVAAHGVFGARKALTGLVPGKENREQLKNQINSQQQAFNEKVDTSLHQATDEKIGQLNKQINAHNKELEEQKKQEHEQRMQQDPKYAAEYKKKQKDHDEGRDHAPVKNALKRIGNGILKTPGKILKNIGQSMQKNKPNAYTPYEEDEEERKRREAEEDEKLRNDPPS